MERLETLQQEYTQQQQARLKLLHHEYMQSMKGIFPFFY